MALLAWLSFQTNYQFLIAYFLALEPDLPKLDSDPLIFGYSKFVTVLAVVLPGATQAFSLGNFRKHL
jgi:hypothetical protein